jgi:hypothetical protein
MGLMARAVVVGRRVAPIVAKAAIARVGVRVMVMVVPRVVRRAVVAAGVGVVVMAMVVPRVVRCAVVAAAGVVVIGMVNRRRGASLAIHPPGVTVLVVLLLPNRHAMFDFVDDVSACGEGFGAVARAYAHPYRHLSDRQVSNTVHAGSVLDAESGNCFGDYALTFLDGERLERFVLEVTDGKAFVVVANPAFE